MTIVTEPRNRTAFRQNPDETNCDYTLRLAEILHYIAFGQDETVKLILENHSAYLQKDEFIKKVSDELKKGKTLVSSIRSVVFAFNN